jgi:mono/diheme cytochrome c family protein
VHVVPPSTFQSWLASQPANAAPPIGTPPSSANQAGVPGAAATSGAAAPSAKSAAPAGASASGAAAGKSVFTGSAGCASCHTLAAAGATGTVGPDLDTRLRKDCATAASKRVRGATLQKCIFTAITNPYKYLPTGYQAGIMPSTFSHTLTSTQIQSLVMFLASAAK